jgi:hypothetical protein
MDGGGAFPRCRVSRLQRLQSPRREIRAGNEKYAKGMGLLARQLSQRGWTNLPVVGMSVGGNVCDGQEYEGADNGVHILKSSLYGGFIW